MPKYKIIRILVILVLSFTVLQSSLKIAFQIFNLWSIDSPLARLDESYFFESRKSYSAPAIDYLRSHEKTDSKVFTFRQADLVLSVKQSVIDNFDPNLNSLYVSGDFKKFFDKEDVRYVYLPNYSWPTFYNTALGSTLTDLSSFEPLFSRSDFISEQGTDIYQLLQKVDNSKIECFNKDNNEYFEGSPSRQSKIKNVLLSLLMRKENKKVIWRDDSFLATKSEEYKKIQNDQENLYLHTENFETFGNEAYSLLVTLDVAGWIEIFANYYDLNKLALGPPVKIGETIAKEREKIQVLGVDRTPKHTKYVSFTLRNNLIIQKNQILNFVLCSGKEIAKEVNREEAKLNSKNANLKTYTLKCQQDATCIQEDFLAQKESFWKILKSILVSIQHPVTDFFSVPIMERIQNKKNLTYRDEIKSKPENVKKIEIQCLKGNCDSFDVIYIELSKKTGNMKEKFYRFLSSKKFTVSIPMDRAVSISILCTTKNCSKSTRLAIQEFVNP